MHSAPAKDHDHTPARERLMIPSTWFYLGFIVLLSFFTYFYNYQYPPAVFWDEPYHIASAQKYLNNVYFMEQHPPLGKLLIALGEVIVHPNAQSNQFLDTDYAKNFPGKFSFAGYRLMPTILAWLGAPIFFLIFLLITRNSAISALLSFLYVFDNALIVHNRGAMIDSPLIFFALVMILLFLLLLQNRRGRRRFWLLSLALGITFGCIVTTKLVGLVMILLFPILFAVYVWREAISKNTHGHVYAQTRASKLLRGCKAGCAFLGIAGLGFLIAFTAVWQIHFALGRKIQPQLNNNGYYQASDAYKRLIATGQTASLKNFPLMIRDSLAYVPFYNRGVPRLDLCKPDENGSPYFLWPIGARSINYRWEQMDSKMYPDTYRYLYLQSNPVVWLCGLLGVLLCACLLIAYAFFPMREKPKNLLLIVSFLALYGGYMFGVSRLDRVMYLYHYFLPLLVSFILFGLAVTNIQRVGRWQVSESRTVIGLTVLGMLIFVSYQFYRPLSYYLPITNKSFEKRELMKLWELKCVNCQKKSTLVVPVASQQQ